MNTYFESYLAPAKAINELTIKNIEKVVNHQVKTIQDNAKIGLESLKSAAEIKDVDGWKAYVTGQLDVARSASENLVSDAKAFAELGQEYTNEIRSIVESAIPVNK